MKNFAIDLGIEKLNVDFQGMEIGNLLNEMLSTIGPEMLNEVWSSTKPIFEHQLIEVNTKSNPFY